MVAVIKSGSAIRRTFFYNENKVSEGVAELLMAGNYPMDLQAMQEHHRLQMLLKTAEKNPDVARSSMHITLNFAPGEQLSDELLKTIAAEYMDGIGFGDQPYLVYKHNDAGHPHIHIATVKIRPDGSRISTQNIGRNQSEQARKAIENNYGLVKAEDHKRQVFTIKPVSSAKVVYGKIDTRRAIGNVLEQVLNTYKYCSLSELNAVLNLYNIGAERGTETSRTFAHRGLLYRVLGADGKPVGVPIKASSFHNKPTLDFLEKKFLPNDVDRQQHKDKLKTAIDFALKTKQKSVESFEESLRKKGINMVLRRSVEGQLYGITYIDLKSKCVFNGSALGKNYSAKAIIERCSQPLKSENTLSQLQKTTQEPTVQTENQQGHTHASGGTADPSEKGLLETLWQYENTSDFLPYELRTTKKKRKKKQS